MDIFSNPFYILGATPQDNEQQLEELKQEKSSWLDPITVSTAHSALTDPQKRLAAELCWFPNVSKSQVIEVMDLCTRMADGQPQTMVSFSSFKNIAALNFKVYTLPSTAGISSSQAEYAVLGMSRLFEMVDIHTLMKDINLDRAAAGIATLVEIVSLENEMHSYQQKIVESIQIWLSKLPHCQYQEVMAFLK
ncbi:MAG: hypothetical protein RSA20_08010 [Oscillospiraceae bacterium]